MGYKVSGRPPLDLGNFDVWKRRPMSGCEVVTGCDRHDGADGVSAYAASARPAIVTVPGCDRSRNPAPEFY